MSLLEPRDIKGLLSKLGAIRGEKEEVEKHITESRQGPRGPGFNRDDRGNGSPPRRGGLASRLGPPPGPGRGSLASRLGPAPGANRQQDRMGNGRGMGGDGPGMQRKRTLLDRGDDAEPRKRRLRSLVSVPGQEGEEGSTAGQSKDAAADDTMDTDKDKKDEGVEEEDGASKAASTGEDKAEDVSEVVDKAEAQPIYKKAEVQQRNRRMFGMLMGHLGKAKERITQDESGILARQKQVVAAVADKDKTESEKIKQRLRESREKARSQDYRKKAELILEAKIVEKQLELARFVNSLVRCKAFIRTKAEPAVYFLPATMSERAEALLSASVSDMEAQVKAKEEECEAAIQSLRDDFERQYKQADKTEDAPQPDEAEGEEKAKDDEASQDKDADAAEGAAGEEAPSGDEMQE